MNSQHYTGYVRVSDAKQSEGASLAEQKRVIAEFATKRGLVVGEWVEEVYSAAKPGRPQFGSLLRKLRARKTKGVIIHKIDRNARNMKDWGDFCHLLDSGLEAYAAGDNLDLQTREGRLFADLLASLACDYIRNLRSEIAKGMLGRLHQGLWPYAAPLGYLNTGKGGKVKAVDTERRDLVLLTFKEYARGERTLESLRAYTKRIGLTTRGGGTLTVTKLTNLIRNPFYMGLMKDPIGGEVFEGRHESIVPASLFGRVQDVLNGRLKPRATKHDYLFRRTLACARCKRSLIGERQKERVYYRCHTRGCPTTSVREDRVESSVLEFLRGATPHPDWRAVCLQRLEKNDEQQAESEHRRAEGLRLKERELEQRRQSLIDAVIEGLIDRSDFAPRKESLERELALLRERMLVSEQESGEVREGRTKKLELLESLMTTYIQGGRQAKRRILGFATSNLRVDGRELEIIPVPALRDLARSPEAHKCEHPGSDTRTPEQVLDDALGAVVEVVLHSPDLN